MAYSTSIVNTSAVIMSSDHDGTMHTVHASCNAVQLYSKHVYLTMHYKFIEAQLNHILNLFYSVLLEFCVLPNC